VTKETIRFTCILQTSISALAHIEIHRYTSLPSNGINQHLNVKYGPAMWVGAFGERPEWIFRNRWSGMPVCGSRG